MMKKLTFTLALLSAIAFGSTAAAGNSGITFLGKPVQMDSPPITDKGRVLIPLRVVSETFGATVSWNQQTRTVIIDKWTQRISLTLGQQTAVVESHFSNGSSKETISLDGPVKTVHNQIYVPIRLVSEFFGYRINWANRTVFIKSPMSDKERVDLYAGDLTTARKVGIKAAAFGGGDHYDKPALDTVHPTENYNNEFFFPTGEALRFFTFTAVKR